MTTDRTMERFLETFFKNTIGFDDLGPAMKNPNYSWNNTSFPPYDIIRTEDGGNEIHVALAGYNKADINVTEDDGCVILATSTDLNTDKEDDVDDFQYRGIAKRKFELKFQLGGNREVTAAKMLDGMLTISIGRTHGVKKLTID